MMNVCAKDCAVNNINFYILGNMETILDTLHNDHVNFIKLLIFIENEIDKIKKCELVDFETMLLCMKYMKEFPDAIHHPLENILFEYYLKHYDDHRDEINALFHEHEEMPVLTENILHMLQSVLAEEPISRDALCENLSKYIDIQKSHMNHEESVIYPVLYSAMKDNDWKKLHDLKEVSVDPLFGKNKKESYQSLFTIITASI